MNRINPIFAATVAATCPPQFRKEFEGDPEPRVQELPKCPGCLEPIGWTEVRCEYCHGYYCPDCALIHDDVATCITCAPGMIVRTLEEIETDKAYVSALQKFISDDLGMTPEEASVPTFNAQLISAAPDMP